MDDESKNKIEISCDDILNGLDEVIRNLIKARLLNELTEEGLIASIEDALNQAAERRFGALIKPKT